MKMNPIKLAQAVLPKVTLDNHEENRQACQGHELGNEKMQCDWCNRFFTSQRGVERHKTYCAWHPQRLKGKSTLMLNLIKIFYCLISSGQKNFGTP